MSRQILDVFVGGVDDFGELLSFDHLLEDIHSDAICIEVH